MAEHTPGPWAVAKGSDQYISADGVWIASTMGTRGETGAANARLAAASPELLEALQALCREFFPSPKPDDFPEWKNARAAIAKALGTEN